MECTHFDCRHRHGKGHAESVEPTPIPGVHCTRLEVVVWEWLVEVGNGDSTGRTLDDYSAFPNARNRPFGPLDQKGNDRDVGGDHTGLHDEGACGLDDVDIGCETSVGFRAFADSNGVWNASDFDVRMVLADTTILGYDDDSHQTRSW